MKLWQRGYDLELLRSVSGRFREAEKGRHFGMFGKADERWVAERLAEDRLFVSDEGCVAVKRYKSATPWRRHNGEVAARFPAGAVVVERFVGDASAALRGVHALAPDARPAGLQSLLPHFDAFVLADLLNLSYVGAKVPAGGSITGLWADNCEAEPYSFVESASALRLPTAFDGAHLRLLAEAKAAGIGWAQHYSGYNKRGSWTAVSLRGYGGVDDIEKPAEMSRKWKADHPGWESLRCADTPLRASLPSVEPILAALGIRNPDRVRLMRLDAGDGELTRHADITDREAGFGPGLLARIHVPLVTNACVVFTAWSLLDGLPTSFSMQAGSVWALDQIKPHAAINGGLLPRIHLVVDAPIEGATARLLNEGMPPCRYRGL